MPILPVERSPQRKVSRPQEHSRRANRFIQTIEKAVPLIKTTLTIAGLTLLAHAMTHEFQEDWEESKKISKKNGGNPEDIYKYKIWKYVERGNEKAIIEWNNRTGAGEESGITFGREDEKSEQIDHYKEFYYHSKHVERAVLNTDSLAEDLGVDAEKLATTYDSFLQYYQNGARGSAAQQRYQGIQEELEGMGIDLDALIRAKQEADQEG